MSREDKLKIITDETVRTVLSVSNKVEKIILFGSQARGDSVEGSDIDILVVADIPKELLSAVKREMRNYASDTGLKYDEVISLIIITKQEYETMGKTLFYQNVANDGIELSITDDEKIDLVAKRILKKYKRAFLELAKWC